MVNACILSTTNIQIVTFNILPYYRRKVLGTVLLSLT